MFKRISWLAGITLVLCSPSQRLQEQPPFNVAVPIEELSTIFTTLYGPERA